MPGKTSITNESLKELFVNREKIKRTLEVIKSTEDFLEKQRQEFSKENKNDAVDSLANTYFKAQKALLEKLKEGLTS